MRGKRTHVPGLAGLRSVPMWSVRLAAWSANTVTYTFTSATLQSAWGPGESDPFVCGSGNAGGDEFFMLLMDLPTNGLEHAVTAAKRLAG